MNPTTEIIICGSILYERGSINDQRAGIRNPASSLSPRDAAEGAVVDLKNTTVIPQATTTAAVLLLICTSNKFAVPTL